MASLTDGYESGHYLSPEFTTETLFKYKYGVACVSNVDGRGNVSIYAMIRRQGKNSKPIFDYANILIYVGGEIRDGFCNANLKEVEALRFMQTHIELSRGRTIRMISVPVEEVSAMFVLPLRKLWRGVWASLTQTQQTHLSISNKLPRTAPMRQWRSFLMLNLEKVPESLIEPSSVVIEEI